MYVGQTLFISNPKMIGRNSISDRGITEKKSKDKSEAVVEQVESPRSTISRKSSKKKKPRRPSKGLGRRNLGTDFTPGPWDGKFSKLKVLMHQIEICNLQNMPSPH